MKGGIEVRSSDRKQNQPQAKQAEAQKPAEAPKAMAATAHA
jgi:hypothetical protein